MSMFHDLVEKLRIRKNWVHNTSRKACPYPDASKAVENFHARLTERIEARLAKRQVAA